MKNKNIIFHIDGGIGKNILATSVVASIKKYYGEDWNIIIVTAWEQIWFFNPHIHRCYNANKLEHFYETHIKDCELKIFKQEPYSTEDYILKNLHLIDIWCNLCGVENLNIKPQIYLNELEIGYVRNNFNKEKPYFVIQPFGGANPNLPYSWSRDIPLPIAQAVVDTLKKNYEVFQIRNENQPLLKNVNSIHGDLRATICFLMLSDKRLLIDSFAQHACNGFNLKSTVCWIVNSPNVLGYKLHNNIMSKEPNVNTLKYSYLEPYNITGEIVQYPFSFNIDKLFDVDEIIDSLLK